MRPKRRALVWSENLASAEDLAYVLNIENRFKATVWDELEPALQLLTERPIDILICFTNGVDHGVNIAELAKQKQPRIRTFALTFGKTIVVDQPLWEASASATTPRTSLIKIFKILTQGKPGPASGSRWTPAQERAQRERVAYILASKAEA